MVVKNIFYLEETASNPGKYMISVHHDQFFCKATVGSYHVLPARLLGIDFADFLRLCRDEGGAELTGKGTWYPMAYFNNDDNAKKFVKFLNHYATMVLWNKEHPDYAEHEAALQEFYTERAKQISEEKDA